MTELLPCPFCGSSATTVEIDTHDSWDYIAACNNDECKLAVYTHGFPDEPAAIEAWNTRATAAPVVVGEDMVERACVAFFSDWEGTPESGKAHLRNVMHESLTAALAVD